MIDFSSHLSCQIEDLFKKSLLWGLLRLYMEAAHHRESSLEFRQRLEYTYRSLGGREWSNINLLDILLCHKLAHNNSER